MRLSIHMERYALGYALVGIAVLLVVGLLMLSKTEAVATQFQARSIMAAQGELSDARQHMLRKIKTLANRLASWDEAAQQLQNPTYYVYWRDTRASQAMDIPMHVVGIELYNANGVSLSMVRNSQSPNNFPANIPDIGTTETTKAVVREEQGKLYFYKFYPVIINDNEGEVKLLGFIALKIDFVAGLRDSMNARYIDEDSIQFDMSQPSSYITLDKALGLIRFNTVPLPEIAQLEENVSTVIVQYSIIGLAALILAWIFLGRQVAFPIKQIVAHINALEAGEKNTLSLAAFARIFRVKELDAVATAINEYQNRLEDLHLDMEHQHRQLEEMAHTDALTGAANRRGLDLYWDELKANRRLANKHVAMILFDCDHFKAINDTYGHDAGDKVLVGIVEAINRLVRTDNRPFRLGGDEFALILLDVDPEEVQNIAARALRAIVEHTHQHVTIGEPIKVSIGIAWEQHLGGTELGAMKMHADIAMYQAKRPASSKIITYSDSMQQSGMMLSNRIAHLVHEAIRAGVHIEMHYQKILPFNDGPDYYEALVRLRDGPENLIPPGDIFPFIEAKSLEVEFDRAIINAITRDLENGTIPVNAGLSINLSPPSLNDDEVIGALFKLKKACVESRKLVVEITENTLISDLDAAAKHIKKLHQMGFIVALDDFGSGYSSLAYLTNMPVDIVKFDITMIKSSHVKGEFSAIVATLSKLLKDAGYTLVAEGVEDKILFDQVKIAGFHYAQGYFIDKPSLFSSKEVSRGKVIPLVHKSHS